MHPAQVLLPDNAPISSAGNFVTAGAPDDTSPHVDQDDLGFGRVVGQQVRGRFLNRDGSPNTRKFGLGPQRLERFYLAALSASWLTFLGWSLAGVVATISGRPSMPARANDAGVPPTPTQIGSGSCSGRGKIACPVSGARC